MSVAKFTSTELSSFYNLSQHLQLCNLNRSKNHATDVVSSDNAKGADTTSHTQGLPVSSPTQLKEETVDLFRLLKAMVLLYAITHSDDMVALKFVKAFLKCGYSEGFVENFSLCTLYIAILHGFAIVSCSYTTACLHRWLGWIAWMTLE